MGDGYENEQNKFADNLMTDPTTLPGLLNAPCAICGFNGPGYWQRTTHSRDCPWHFVAGKEERERACRALMPRFKTPPAAPTGWRPIATAPKADETGNDDRVIVSDGKEVCTAEFTNGRWIVSPTAWEGDGDHGGLVDCPFEPTHWMPLPAAPLPTTGPAEKDNDR